MKAVVVGVADCQVSNDPDVSLITYALGSCIAVVVYDPVIRIGGMLHYMLPEASLDQDKARQNPYMFADTGIVRLFEKLAAHGMQRRRSMVRLAGGAWLLRQTNSTDCFEIGKRNYLAAKRILWKQGVLISAEAVGGEVSRTVRLEVAKGNFFVRESGGANVFERSHCG